MTRKCLVAVAFISAMLVLRTAPAAAHPGVGIVLDRAGNVFYTDLVHIWKIAPDGTRTVAVRDVHSHELAIDGNGVLYGEDSDYEGGDRYSHRVWRRLPNGRVEDVIPRRDGFWREYGFVRDARGTMYWTRCPDRVCTIRSRAPNGPVRTVPMQKGAFRDYIQWIAAAPSGGLFVLDSDAVKLLKPDGSVRTVARALGGSPMGMLPESDGSVLVAVYNRRAIVRVTPAGGVQVVAQSPAPWGPSGVAKAANGDLWVLEYSTSNEARVRRVTAASPRRGR